MAVIPALLMLLAATPAPGPLAVGDPLPRLAGRYLTGDPAVLPGDANGQVALLALGFSYASRVPVEAWSERFRARFGSDHAVTGYEIPMIGGMSRLGRPFIDGGMKRGTPEALHRNVITVYGDTRPWRNRLGVKDRDAAYLVLIDAAGRVAWIHRGGFETAAFETLVREVRRLQAAPNAGATGRRTGP